MELQSLRQIVHRPNGFLGINASTNDIEIQNAHFFGKLVVWIRYKTSESYRRAIHQAKNKLVDAMVSDETYSKYFKEKISREIPEFLTRDKPISARDVHTFIVEVEHHASQAQSTEAAKRRDQRLSAAKDLIAKFSAHTGEDGDCQALDAKIDAILQRKTATEPGVDAANINREGIGEELYKGAIANEAKIIAIDDDQGMEAFVDSVLSDILEQRVGNAKEKLQSVLRERLSAAALPDDIRQTVEGAIRTSQIVDEKQLDKHVNNIILKLAAADFDGLLDQACRDYGFDKAAFESLDIKQSLPAYLLDRSDQRLSFTSVSQYAIDFFREQGQKKKAEAEMWIAKLSGTDGTLSSRKEFKSRLDKMFKLRIAREPGLNNFNVALYRIDETVRQAALNYSTEITTEEQANTLIDTLMSDALDKRVASAREGLQLILREELADIIGLSSQNRQAIEAKIDSVNIATRAELNQRVIALFLERIDDGFDDLVKEASKQYRFSKGMLAAPREKEQLLQHLKSDLTEHARYAGLSFASAQSKAVEQLNRQRLDLVNGWVKRWSDADGNDGPKLFRDELSKRQVPVGMKGFSAEELGAEVSQEVLGDPKEVAAIESEADAKAIVLNKLSALLKPRLEQARLESQEKLYQRVREAKLPEFDHKNLEDEIASFRITTMGQLDRAIKTSVVKQINSEFENLLQRVKDGYKFKEEVASLDMLKEQLHEKLVSQDMGEIVSVNAVRDQAISLLEQWLSAKEEALAAVTSSRFLGTEALLKKLVLQEPYMTKNQVEEFQQAIEQTLDEAYGKYAASDEARTMEPQQVFSRLEQPEHQEALYEKLTAVLRQTAKPASVFDGELWHATGIDVVAREHIADAVSPLLETSRHVDQLRSQVPNSVYQGARKAMIDQDMMWGNDFIAMINGTYIDTLKDNSDAELYALLESPEVAQREIGAKSDQTSFTFKDLVESAIKKEKNIRDEKKIHQAIDKLIPAEEKDYLFKSIENSLLQVRDKVMIKTAANELFQESAINALQNAKIDFERKRISFSRQTLPPPHYETTV